MKIDLLNWLKYKNIDISSLDAHLRNAELRTALFTIIKQYPSLYGAFFDEFVQERNCNANNDQSNDYRSRLDELTNELTTLQELNDNLMNQQTIINQRSTQLNEENEQLRHEIYTMRAGVIDEQKKEANSNFPPSDHDPDMRTTVIINSKHNNAESRICYFIFWIILALIIIVLVSVLINITKYSKINKHKDTFKLIKRTRYI